MKKAICIAFSGVACAMPIHAQDAGTQAIKKELEALKEQVRQLEQRLEEEEQATAKAQSKRENYEEDLQATRQLAESAAQEADRPIEVGGAVRVQYAFRGFDPAQEEREGNFELDTIRFNFDGELGDVLLSAEYRFYEFMDVVHHAWFGYDFSDIWQIQAGFHKVPFGVLPFSSNSFFFSSNYYTGFEDDYDAGIKLIGDYDRWNYQLAYYANDEITFGARNERYTYDVLRDNSGNELEENNTFNLRVAHTWQHGVDATSELGFSAQYGRLADAGAVDGGRGATGEDVGDNDAFGLHLHGNYGPWGLMLQAMRYEYDMDNGDDIVGVGAYAFDDAIAAKAYSYIANTSYGWGGNVGPVTNIRWYNDFSYITDKSAGLPSTWMNVLGAAISAGGLFTYVDFVYAKNQPFIGGSVAGDGAFNNLNDVAGNPDAVVPAIESGNEEMRFNVNFGYYF